MVFPRFIINRIPKILFPCLSKVDENMKRAQKRDAVRTQKFWWRKDIFTVCSDNKVKLKLVRKYKGRHNSFCLAYIGNTIDSALVT